MNFSKLLRFTFIFLPLLEIAGFIVVGSAIGVLPTLLLIIAACMLGGAILRGGGLVQLMNIQQRIRSGELPTYHALEGPMIFFAGFLLLIPGFITDIIGLLLLIPFIRKLLLHWMLQKGYIRQEQTPHRESETGGRIIEGEFKRRDEK